MVAAGINGLVDRGPGTKGLEQDSEGITAIENIRFTTRAEVDLIAGQMVCW